MGGWGQEFAVRRRAHVQHSRPPFRIQQVEAMTGDTFKKNKKTKQNTQCVREDHKRQINVKEVQGVCGCTYP